ncbi:MAG: hypothetical protein EBU50_01935 [Opitutae bacterium]|nr:hypothetical protein [Opitutae bacterium]
MIGANAMTINGSGAAGVGGVIKNSNATGATYVGAVTLASDSTITAGTGNITLSGGLGISTYTATINGAQNTTLSGAVTGSGAINKSGAGTLTLSNGGNTYTGSLNIDQGTVTFASANASAFSASTSALSFGASNTPTLTLAGKSLTRGAISSTNTNAIIENNNATQATLTSSAAADSTFAGVMRDGTTGTLAFTKAGAGVLTLSNTNTYSGATTVAGGTLKVTGSAANTAITVNSGATLTAAGTVGAVTVNSGATLTGAGTAGTTSVSGTIAPGSAGIGNLTLGSTTLSGGGTLNVQIFDFNGAAGTTGWDLLTTGALNIGAASGNTFNIAIKSIGNQTSDATGTASNFNKSSNYSMKILSASSITGYADNAWTINSLGFTNVSSGTWSVSQSGTDILLNYTAVSAQFWNGASGWDSSLTNGGSGTWDTGSGGYDSTVTVNFGGTAGAVTVGSPTTTKAIKFQADGYSLSSGSITMNGADTTANAIDVGTDMTATIGSRISSSSVQVNKTGLGTLVLSGDNSSSGISAGLLISNGRLKISDAGALGASSSAVTVSSGATLDLNGQVVTNTNALTLSGTGAASAGGALINTGTGAATYAGLVTLGAASTINASLV